jgi:hypothetical protein
MKAIWTPTQWGRARVTLRWVPVNAVMSRPESFTKDKT